DLIGALSTTIEFTQDIDGTITRENLELLLTDDQVTTVMAILDGTSTLTEAEKQAFFTDEPKVALFLSDLEAAKTNLIGTAALLAAGQPRFEYVLEPLMAYLNLKAILLN